MRKTILWVVMAAAVLLNLTQCHFSEEARAEASYKKYCGVCHQLPDPGTLSKELWMAQVLPEMGARLGIKVGDYNPVKNYGIEEAYFIEQLGTYPKEPLLSQAEWESIYKYVIERAPDSLEVDTLRHTRSLPMDQFQARAFRIDKLAGAQVTALYPQDAEAHWWVGTRSGEWFSWSFQDSSKLVYLFSSAVSGFERQSKEELVIEMGYMNPSDVPKGRLWRFEDGRRSVLAEGLYRPVYVAGLDIHEDGIQEYIIGEFGNRTGSLSLLEQEGGRYKKRVLISQPGMIRIQLADMNKDGKQDIVALAGQGDEGIYILYQQGDGKFSLQHPIKLPPVYGSSWFELFDYEGDGDLDVGIVNGDNADFTYALKPYHGFRIFLNDGADNFDEAFFYPIYGATRLIARDFDQDGDQDFAIAALFPDFEHNAQESFLYLENQESASFSFQSYTSPATLAGHWLVMGTADVDQDNDLDILLGSYVGSPAPVPDSLNRKWMNQNVDLLWLENRMGAGAQ